MSIACFLQPVDVLFLRGNKLFGDAGSYGESLIPPWPSVAAGAIRSRLLVDDGIDLARFARGEEPHPALGTPASPGKFRLLDFQLARRTAQGVEILRPLPADLVATLADDGTLKIRQLMPEAPAEGFYGSLALPRWPLLASDDQAKPEHGLWLDEAGWRTWLSGELPSPDHCVSSERLWSIDNRVGVGLDTTRRRAADGQLFTVQAVAFHDHLGFLIRIEGAELPDGGLVRFGGDGRAATLRDVDPAQPEPDYAAIAEAGRCRLVLTSPGIFPDGWRLPGMTEDGHFSLGGVQGRVVSAAVSRAETVSGWDLARREPKPAQRVAPTGSVYWIEDLQTTHETLRKFVIEGLWPEENYDTQRRAEGFNRLALGIYR